MTDTYTDEMNRYISNGIPDSIAKVLSAASYYNTNGITIKDAVREGTAEGADITNLNCVTVLDALGLESFGSTKDACTATWGDWADNTYTYPGPKPYDYTTTVGTASQPDEKYVKGVAESYLGDSSFEVNDDGLVVVVGTRAGANITTPIGTVRWTDNVLKSMANTWTGGTVGRNHETFDEGRIISSEYKEGKAYFLIKPSEKLAGELDKAVGVSVEALLKVDENTHLTRDGKGTGITFIFDPKRPACSVEDGCVAVGEEGTEVKPMSDTETNDAVNEYEDKYIESQASLDKMVAAVAERDETMQKMETELEELRTFKAQAEANEIETLKTELFEFGVAEDAVPEDANAETIKTLIAVAKASADKATEEVEIDSGVSATASEPESDKDRAKALVEKLNKRGY